MIGFSSLSVYAFIGFLVGVVWINPWEWYREYRFFKDRGVSAGHWREWIWVPVSVVFWPLVLVLLCLRCWNAISGKIRGERERIRHQEEYKRLKDQGWEEEWIYPEIAESREVFEKENLSIVNHALRIKHESKEARVLLKSLDRLKVMQEWEQVSERAPDFPIRLVDPELNRRRKLAWETQQEINRTDHGEMIREALEKPSLSDHERRIISNLRQTNSYYDPMEDDPVQGPIIKQVNDEVSRKKAGQRVRCHSLWYEVALTLRERHGIIWFPPSEMNPGEIYD